MREPTKRQSEVLEYLAELEAEGLYPTLREIGEHFGILSTNGVNDHLRALQFKGLIHRTEIISRSIRLTDKGKAWVGHVDPRTLALREAFEKLKELGPVGFREWIADEIEAAPKGSH